MFGREGRNLQIREKSFELPKNESPELTNLAKEIVSEFGSTVGGVSRLRDELLAKIPEENRSNVEINPDFTRSVVCFYNEALKQAGIEDEMQLYYHFTGDEGVEGIEKDRVITAGKGMGAISQIKDTFRTEGLLPAIETFWKADNWERVAIHAAANTPPEVARSRGEDVITGFKQRLMDVFKASNTLGLSQKYLTNYYEIITAKSDRVFNTTVQAKLSRLPVIPFNIDEVYSNINDFPVGLGEKTLVLGPRVNPYVERIGLERVAESPEMQMLAKQIFEQYGDTATGREQLTQELIRRMGPERYSVMSNSKDLQEVVEKLLKIF